MPQPPKSPFQKSPNLQDREKTASTLLSNLEAEIQTTQKHSAELRQEAERQTKKILQNRAAQLADLEKLGQERLEPLHIQEERVKNDIKEAETCKLELETIL